MSKRTPARTTVLWVIRVAVLAGTGVFVVRSALNSADQLRVVHIDLDWVWAASAAATYAAASLLFCAGWRELLASFGHRLGAVEAGWIWFLSQLGRYVPFNVGVVSFRAVLLRRADIAAGLGATTTALETLFLLIPTATAAIVVAPDRYVHDAVRVIGASVGVVALLMTPLLCRWVQRSGAARWPKLTVLAPEPVDVAVMRRAGALYSANSLLRVAAWSMLCMALLPEVGADELPTIAAAYLLANFAGFIGVTPAGLGVREGALVALLGGTIGVGDAAACAAVLRAAELCFDVVGVILAGGAQRLRRRRDGARPGGVIAV